MDSAADFQGEAGTHGVAVNTSREGAFFCFVPDKLILIFLILLSVLDDFGQLHDYFA
jgi:hypothetical protein